MSMRVVRVGHMRMGVVHRFMSMQVTVGARWHGLMLVKMVAIVVRVRMFVRHRLMVMPVSVVLHQVQRDAGHHQGAAQHQAPATRSIAQDPRQGRAHEGREGVHRARSGGTE